jgi:hypothetical protein
MDTWFINQGPSSREAARRTTAAMLNIAEAGIRSDETDARSQANADYFAYWSKFLSMEVGTDTSKSDLKIRADGSLETIDEYYDADEHGWVYGKWSLQPDGAKDLLEEQKRPLPRYEKVVGPTKREQLAERQARIAATIGIKAVSAQLQVAKKTRHSTRQQALSEYKSVQHLDGSKKLASGGIIHLVSVV